MPRNQTILNKHQFNKAKSYIIKLMHKAKSEFYLIIIIIIILSEITSATSKKSLFAVCNNLLGLEKLPSFPNIYLFDQQPAIFNDFFN